MHPYFKLFLTGLLTFASSLLLAQTGSFRGTVLDDSTGEPLIGSTAVVAGTSIGSVTDLDGKFSIDKLEPGTYQVQVSYISYQTQIIENVLVEPGKVTVLNVRLASEALGLEEVVVRAEMIKDNEAALLTIQKKSSNLLDGISSQQFSRGGDNDAASAIKRVTGVSVEGGKYVYVRGLGDRYSKTSLNNAEVPGLDPNRNTVQMDLFPSNLIDNIIVYKSFSPEIPGSFSGGYINITTKDFPDQFILQASASGGFNSNATFNDNYLTHELGGKHWLGYGSDVREMPAVIADGVTHISYNEPAVARKVNEEVLSLSNRSFTPINDAPNLDHSLSFSIGNQKEILGKKLGFIGGASYQREYQYYSAGQIGRYFLPGTIQEEDLEVIYELEDQRGQETVLWGAIFNTALKLNSYNKIGLNFMRNQSSHASTRYLEGTFPFASGGDPNFYFQSRALEYTQRSLSTAQLNGEHVFPQNLIKIDWMGAFTKSSQNEPDLRYFSNLRIGEGPEYSYDVISNNVRPASHYFRDMIEDNIDLKVNVEIPIEAGEFSSKIKFGSSYITKERIFNENIIEYRNPGSVSYNNNIGEYFAEENLGTDIEEQTTPYSYGLYLRNVTSGVGNYRGNQIIPSAYAMIDWQLSGRLKVSTGARYEQTNIEIVNIGDGDELRNTLVKDDILPALNATYVISDKTNLRMAYGRTVARPTFRELALFKSFDFQGDFILIGNPHLQRTSIDNFDLRWETYPRSGEIISISAFYKNFNNPIERAIDPNTNDLAVQVFFRNVPTARLLGLEFEMRKNLGFIGETFKNISIGANLAYIYSRVDISEGELKVIRVNDPDSSPERVMFGQSPYIVNALIGYDNIENGWHVNLNYNVQGQRLSVVSTGGTPNVYEQPRPVLDLTAGKQLNSKWGLKFSAKNLLDSDYAQTHNFKGETYYYSRYRLGREFSTGITFLIE